MNRNNSSTLNAGTAQNQQGGRVIECNECQSTYVVPHRRQIHRKKRGSQRLNDIAMTELTFSSDNSIWRKNIVFRKRNIEWKAIKSEKTEKEQLSDLSSHAFNDDAEISQNKDLTSSSEQIAAEQMKNMLAEGRCPSCNSLIDMDDNTNIKSTKNGNSDSSSSDSDDEIEDDNIGIISEKLTNLDVPENNESRESFLEHSKCKRLTKVIDISKMPREIQLNKNLRKYWINRYELFHKYDEGIQLDRESWYSVTPERIAKQIARRCKCNIIIDAFCGAGSNAIQFAFTCNKVIAIDINPKKIKLAYNNAKVYGVEKNIEFIIGDFFKLVPKLKADVVFLSPPWGGPEYSETLIYDLNSILPVGGKKVYEAAKHISKSIAYYLPKNININQVRMLAKRGEAIETELYLEYDKLIAITCYYGELMTKK